MKRIGNVLLCLLLTAAMLIVMGGCNTGGDKNSSASGTNDPENLNPNQRYVPEEPVTIIWGSWEDPLQMAFLTEGFNSTHKNITVEPYQGYMSNEELTRLAAAGELPDVFSFFDMGLAIKNQWLADLTPYYKDDPLASVNFKQNIDWCTFNGKLYALSIGMFISCLNVNLDLLEMHNIEKPSYEWTVDEAVDIMKATTVPGETLGSLLISWLNSPAMCAAGRKEISYNGLNLETRRFDLGDEWLTCMNTYKELFDAKVSLWEHTDIVGDQFREQNPDADASQIEEARNQYILSQFGTLEDGWAVGKTSMQPFETFQNGWEVNNPRGSDHPYTGFNYDSYPIPKGNGVDGIRFGITGDFAGISSNAADPKAAYEFLRYISYDIESYKARKNGMMNYNRDEYMEKYMDMFTFLTADNFPMDSDKMKLYVPAAANLIPPVNTDEARQLYRELHYEGTPTSTPGISYMLDHIETSGYLYPGRVLPGFYECVDYIWSNFYQEVVLGDKTAADIAKELETYCNENLAEWEAIVSQTLA